MSRSVPLPLTALLLAAIVGLGPHQTSAQSPPAVREASADLPGVHLFYTDTGGSGAPVVFVHAIQAMR